MPEAFTSVSVLARREGAGSCCFQTPPWSHMGCLIASFGSPIFWQGVDKMLVLFFGQLPHQPSIKLFLRKLIRQQFACRWLGGSGHLSGIYSHDAVSSLHVCGQLCPDGHSRHPVTSTLSNWKHGCPRHASSREMKLCHKGSRGCNGLRAPKCIRFWPSHSCVLCC